jgi:hypothetical protein
MWNLGLVCLEILLVLEQDWFLVCAECTIGSEIVLAHLMELPDDVRHVQSHFGLFGDSVSVSAR